MLAKCYGILGKNVLLRRCLTMRKYVPDPNINDNLPIKICDHVTFLIHNKTLTTATNSFVY